MFEFNLTLGVYIPVTLIALFVISGVFFLEFKLCDANNSKRFKKTALKVCRLYLKTLIGLIALIIISWLIFSIFGMPSAISDIDWSVSDSLFMLFIMPSGWMTVRLQLAAADLVSPRRN